MIAAITTAEGNLLLWIQNILRCPALDVFFANYTSLGNTGLVWIVLCLVFLCFGRTRKAGLCGLLALIFSLVLTNGLLKNLFHRVRPWLDTPGLIPIVTENDPNSFPSGHASAAFACCVAWLKVTKSRWLKTSCIVAASLMALSRLYVGVHYPSDVAVGVLVGIGCGFLAWYITESVVRKVSERRKSDKV